MIDFFVNNAWAAPAQQQPGFMSFVPLIILFIIFYFILIRPQMKQAKQHKQLVASLAKGDEIATNGGLLGKIKEVGDNFIVIEVFLRFKRLALLRYLKKRKLKYKNKLYL